jgi:hypothetical protein
MLSLDIFQSWWAMRFRRPDGFEWSIEERFEKITNADYQGVCFDTGLAHIPYDSLSQYVKYCEQYDLDIVINTFPRNEENVASVINQAKMFNGRCRFISIIGRVVPRTKYLKQGKEAYVPIYVECNRKIYCLPCS